MTEIATASVLTTTGEWTGDDRAISALLAYGRGLLGHTSEFAHEARAPLMLALELAASPAERADAMQSLAQLATIEGRIESAERWIGLARDEVGAHPALSRTLGQAYASRWRNDLAARELTLALESVPLDDRVHRELASALASNGAYSAARSIASRGLGLSPRDPDLLRLQWQSLAKIARPHAGATSAFLEFRSPDEASAIKGMCSKSEPGCGSERLGVHTHPVVRRSRLEFESR